MTDQSPAAGSGQDASRPSLLNRHPAQSARLAYQPVGYARLLALHVVNTLLTIITLSIWRFWAVTQTRRVLWTHIRFDGQPLEYTGTGVEIFIGFLKIVLLILLPLALLVTGLQALLLDAASGTSSALDSVYVLLVLWLVSAGQYLSLRYRTSRTRWRGIRSRLAGRVGPYLWLTLWTAALTVITLGLYKPWMDAKRIRFALHGARAGSLPVTCRIVGGDLFWSWLLTLLLWPFTLGLSYFWYRARMFRLVADRAEVGPLRFGFTATGWQHAGLWLGNVAMLYGGALVGVLFLQGLAFVLLLQSSFSVGQAPTIDLIRPFLGGGLLVLIAAAVPYLALMPFVWERRIRFVCRHLAILGAVDLAAIRQTADDPATAGEGLLGDFDAF